MAIDGNIITNIENQCNVLPEGGEKQVIIRQISEELYLKMQEIVTKNGCKLVWDKEKNRVKIYKEPKISEEDLAEFGLEGFVTDSTEVEERRKKAEEELRKAKNLLVLTNYRKEFFDNMMGILNGIDNKNITEEEIIAKLEVSYKALKVLNANNKRVWRGKGKYEDMMLGIDVIESLYGKNRKIKSLLEKIKKELRDMRGKEEIRVS